MGFSFFDNYRREAIHLNGTFAAIDFETANNQPSSVCSVGVVIVRNGQIEDKFYSLIHPFPNYYNYWNTSVHGLRRTDTDLAPIFPEVWEQVSVLIEGLPLVAHNSRFDEGCLRAAFAAYGLNYPGYTFHCTLNASRMVHRHLRSHKLDVVAAACGYDLQNHHHALADAEACAAIALKIMN